MIKLILVRHGQSTWNHENRFTGWTDVPLTDKGVEEAISAGKLLKSHGYSFDMAFTSLLKRSEDTLKYILKELNEEDIIIKRSYKLNERHYGALQGLNKEDTKKKYGSNQVLLWRRSVNERPPLLDVNDNRNPAKDIKYKDIDKNKLPLGENLSDTIKRVCEYYNSDILPELEQKKRILVVAHGNSLRGLISYLDNMNEEDVINLEIETGSPICYELDDNLKPIRHYYVKDE